MRQATQLERRLAFTVLGQRLPKVRKIRRFYRGPIRDLVYREWIRAIGCCCGCGAGPRSEFAHTGDDGGMGQKAADSSGVPLNWLCHREYHRIGRREFEIRRGISFSKIVLRLRQEWRKNATTEG